MARSVYTYMYTYIIHIYIYTFGVSFAGDLLFISMELLMSRQCFACRTKWYYRHRLCGNPQCKFYYMRPGSAAEAVQRWKRRATWRKRGMAQVRIHMLAQPTQATATTELASMAAASMAAASMVADLEAASMAAAEPASMAHDDEPAPECAAEPASMAAAEPASMAHGAAEPGHPDADSDSEHDVWPPAGHRSWHAGHEGAHSASSTGGPETPADDAPEVELLRLQTIWNDAQAAKEPKDRDLYTTSPLYIHDKGKSKGTRSKEAMLQQNAAKRKRDAAMEAAAHLPGPDPYPHHAQGHGYRNTGKIAKWDKSRDWQVGKHRGKRPGHWEAIGNGMNGQVWVGRNKGINRHQWGA